MKRFLSGNEAAIQGVRLSRPNVISVYPIAPQTIMVEKLSEIVEQKRLDARFVYVENERSALSYAVGANAIGSRTFTTTSSQGLLYMAECLPYTAGDKFPIVMVNANHSTAFLWDVFGDRHDSLSQLDNGWIQVYVEGAQEALNTVIEAYYIAEHKKISTLVVISLDGFDLIHTYEPVDVPEFNDMDGSLPKFETGNKFDINHPRNLGFSVGPGDNLEWKIRENKPVMDSLEVIEESRAKFKKIFNRSHGSVVGSYKVEDADYVLISVGSTSGLTKSVVDDLRKQSERVGYLKLRYIRLFPTEKLRKKLQGAKKIGVLEKDVSFGHFGTVYTNVESITDADSQNFVGGLGGRNIIRDDIKEIFQKLKQTDEELNFIGVKCNK